MKEKERQHIIIFIINNPLNAKRSKTFAHTITTNWNLLWGNLMTFDNLSTFDQSEFCNEHGLLENLVPNSFYITFHI